MILNYFPICKTFSRLRPLNFREEEKPSPAAECKAGTRHSLLLM